MGGQICLFVSLLLMFLFLVPSKGWAATDNTTVPGVTFTYTKEGFYCTITGITINASYTQNELTVPAELGSTEVAEIVLSRSISSTTLTSVVVPSSVNYIGSLKGTSLTSITLKETNPPSLGSNAFSTSIVLNVPSGYESTYYNSADFSNYKNNLNIEKKLTDNASTGISSDMLNIPYKAGKLTYERTFGTAGQYGSIALPFAVTSSVWTQYFEQVYTLSSASLDSENKAHLEFSEVTGSIAANTPYFVKLKEGVSKVNFANTSAVTISSNALKQSTKVTFTGNDGVTVTAFASLKKETSTSSVQYYTFNADGSFGPSSEVYPFRMCLKIEGRDGSASAPAFFSIDLPGGSTTGISGISQEAAAKTAYIYSIDGKLVRTDGSAEGLAKGVYVKNGKKFIVK